MHPTLQTRRDGEEGAELRAGEELLCQWQHNLNIKQLLGEGCCFVYSSRKVDYPFDFKYASVSIEYDGVPDSLKMELADSILSTIRKTDFSIVHADNLNEGQRDSLLLVKAELFQRGSEFAIGLSFYPYGGIEFTEVYFSEISKDDPIIKINAASSVPFSENYNRRKAFEILNDGFITKGGIQHLFSKE